MELNKINEEAFKKELVRIVDEHENGGSELEELDNYWNKVKNEEQ